MNVRCSLVVLLVFASVFEFCEADLYMHNPRGSNNRLNERSANRQNGNRLFDSQNNNRGGYNVGDLANEQKGFEENGAMSINGNYKESEVPARFVKMMDKDTNVNEDTSRVQYDPIHLADSLLRATWTNQHGCGNAKNNCNLIVQYTCDSEDESRRDGLRVKLWNGGNTNTPDEPNALDQIETTITNNNDNNRGRHESEEYYYMNAKVRDRNKGLFLADQKLKGHTAKYTRQNPNGNRRGLEIPEERDYWPWWRPSIWRDIAVLTNDVDYCNKELAPFSQNVVNKYSCNSDAGLDDLPTQDQMKASNSTVCTAAGGVWTANTWDLTQPPCFKNEWQQVNSLGNTDRSPRGGQQAYFDWRLPSLASMKKTGCKEYTASNGGVDYKYARMVFRMRYNISTTDYDPFLTNSSFNQNLNQGVLSPIQQNPTVDVGAHLQGLRLAINTAQTGRTFQDRSHVLLVTDIANKPWQNDQIINVNVMGKRGNIVQTFPAIEYSFYPHHVEMTTDQCMHFQWTGSNTHNNGNPAGDGQAGDAGEGLGGTDRSNIVTMKNMQSSYPNAYDTVKAEDNFFQNSKCFWPLGNGGLNPGTGQTPIEQKDCEIIFASSGYYNSVQDANTKYNTDNDSKLNVLLNNASASFRQGVIVCPEKAGDYTLVCTRNNNFTNRAQKMIVRVGTANGFAGGVKR